MTHPYYRRGERPKQRRGSSRNIALRLWAAIYVRGGMRCVWHDQLLTKDNHSIDHFDGKEANNRPDNLLPSCIGCNSKRAEVFEYDDPKQAEAEFDAYLREKGSSLPAALRRAEKQLRTPIPQGARRFSPLHGRAIASIWAPDNAEIDAVIKDWLSGGDKGEDRLAYTRRTGGERAAASRAKEKRAREAAGPAPFDDDPEDFDPFT